MYVAGSAFAGIKRFSGDPAINVLDGEALGGAVTVGTLLGSRWDVEFDVSVPRFTSVSVEHDVMFRRDVLTLRSSTRNQPLSAAALVRFRATPRGRTELGYLVGLSLLRLKREYGTVAPEGTPESLIPRPSASVDYGAAPVIGVDARIALVSRLSLVPSIRASVFKLSDVSALLIRPRIGIRWTF